MEGFLSTKEAIDKYIAGCQAKAQMTNERLFGKAILAGVMIGMGAAASSVAAHTIADVGLARLAAAVVFPVGQNPRGRVAEKDAYESVLDRHFK